MRFAARPAHLCAFRVLWSFTLLSSIGCSSAPGSLFGILPPENHKLIEQARALRQPEPASLPRELDKRAAPPFVVEPGDVVLVQSSDLDSPIRLPGDQSVFPDGTIQLGKYGKLMVAGKTIEEVEGDARRLVETQAKDVPAITVRVVSRSSKVFYVLGEVNNPGAFQLTGRETVLDGIVASAGGLTAQASRDNIILSRPTGPHECRIVLPICYPEIVQLGDTTTNYQLRASDRIYVPSKTLCETLTGADKKPPCPCNGPQTACPTPSEHGRDCTYLPPLPQPPPTPLPTPQGVPAEPPATLEAPRR
jgi:protein involved in polysaccharide export with SLBB domain